jgi:hypothetical protein
MRAIKINSLNNIERIQSTIIRALHGQLRRHRSKEDEIKKNLLKIK